MENTINFLTIEQKVGQLFFIGIKGPEVDAETRELLEEVSPGGVCLFARNIKSAGQTRGLLDYLRNQLPLEPFLSIDQEGGLVDRLRRIMTPMPSASRLRTAADATELASIIAETLRTLGFTMDFAPVADVIDSERTHSSNGLFSREFGRSKEDVAEMAGAFLETLQNGGILGCLKHFPGLGAASVDSHEGLPQIDISGEELYSVDLFPYRELLSRRPASVMVGHASYPNLGLQERSQDGKLLPSSLSRNLITVLLRDELGFDGLVITDDLEMGAIVKNFGIGEACKMAVGAGVDMLAICADPYAIREGYEAILTAVRNGEIATERLDVSLERILVQRSQVQKPLDFDEGRLSELSQQITALNSRLTSR